MRADWDCTACFICREIQAGAENYQELFDKNNAEYLVMGGAHKFLFPDGSILIIDDEGEPSFVNIQAEEKSYSSSSSSPAPKAEKKGWFGKLSKNKIGIGLALGSIIVSSAAVVGAMYYNKH